jgi:hypothetical protein
LLSQDCNFNCGIWVESFHTSPLVRISLPSARPRGSTSLAVLDTPPGDA